MSNRLARLYETLGLISAAREASMELNGKPTKYNLEKGQEVIAEIIAEEVINEHLSNIKKRTYSQS